MFGNFSHGFLEEKCFLFRIIFFIAVTYLQGFILLETFDMIYQNIKGLWENVTNVIYIHVKQNVTEAF